MLFVTLQIINGYKYWFNRLRQCIDFIDMYLINGRYIDIHCIYQTVYDVCIHDKSFTLHTCLHNWSLSFVHYSLYRNDAIAQSTNDSCIDCCIGCLIFNKEIEWLMQYLCYSLVRWQHILYIQTLYEHIHICIYIAISETEYEKTMVI